MDAEERWSQVGVLKVRGISNPKSHRERKYA
jgi:hypothetical protein